MYRNNKTSIIGIVITIIVLIILVLLTNINTNKLSGAENLFSKLVMPVQNGLTHLKNKIAKNDSFFENIDKLDEENKKLKEENSELQKKLQELDIKLIHISTDYVFDGKNFKPYCEEFQTNPQSIYGKTKLDGENEMRDINPKNSIIIRTSWIYSYYGNNFVKTMLRLGKEKEELGVIFDQIGTPTYAKDLAKIILDIVPQIDNQKVEIYNYSNEGVLSWYDFAKEIMKMAKLNCKINPIETYQYPTPAKRPHFSLLNKNKIKSTFNIEIPYWKDGLDDCLRRLGERR
jgi:dTDP-4-dehydrorhamnose reductase